MILFSDQSYKEFIANIIRINGFYKLNKCISSLKKDYSTADMIFCLVQDRQIYFHHVLYSKCSLRRINWVNHNLTCAGCQDPANELCSLSIGGKRRKQ